MIRMTSWVTACIMAAVWIPGTAFTAESSDHKYTWNTISFTTPVLFAQPVKIGMDAVSLLYPNDSQPATAQFDITLALSTVEMQKTMGMDDTQLLDYLKTTFMGASGSAQKAKERTILGKTLTGDHQEQTIPKRMLLDSYLIPLANGDKLMLAFKSDVKMDAAEVEKIIDTVTKTFTQNTQAGASAQ